MSDGRKYYNVQIAHAERQAVKRQITQDSGILEEVVSPSVSPLVIGAIGDGEGEEGRQDPLMGKSMSRRAVDYFVKFIRSDEFISYLETGNIPKVEGAIQKVFKEINNELLHLNQEQRIKKHTTLTGVVIAGNRIFIGHVGNCRVYRLTPEGITQLTRDHTAQPDSMVGKLYQDKYSGVYLTRVMGRSALVDMDFYSHEIKEGHFIILCTDGFYRGIDEESMREIMEQTGNIRGFCEKTIQMAVNNNNTDDKYILGLHLSTEEKLPHDSGEVEILRRTGEKEVATPSKEKKLTPEAKSILNSIIYAFIFILCFLGGWGIYSLTHPTPHTGQPRPVLHSPAVSSPVAPVKSSPAKKIPLGFSLKNPDKLQVLLGEGSDISDETSLSINPQQEYRLTAENGKGLYTLTVGVPAKNILVKQWKVREHTSNEIIIDGTSLEIQLTEGSQFTLQEQQDPPIKLITVTRLGSRASVSFKNCPYIMVDLKRMQE